MTIQLCETRYNRPHQLDPKAEKLFCQYIKDHPVDRHSWFAIKTCDDAELARLVKQDAGCYDDQPVELQAILDAINRGDADKYLEAILAAGHSRKRLLRGVKVPYGITVRPT